MSDISIEYFYGIYPSSIFGNLLLVDPDPSQRTCFFNCITCPIRRSELSRESSETSRKTPPAAIIIRNIEEHLTSGIEINGALIWGFGDPLYYDDIFDLLIALRGFLGERGMGRKIYIHTSLIKWMSLLHENPRSPDKNSPWEQIRPVIEYSDGFIVPFIWYGGDKNTLGWPYNISYSEYLSALRVIFGDHRDRLFIELYVFKYLENTYPERFHLDELITALRYMKVKNIIVKTIDRPAMNMQIKPLPEGYVIKVSNYLVEEGFNVLHEKINLPKAPPKWKTLISVLYNHVLRIPLRYSEIRALYGDLGVIALSNLISKNLVKRINWHGEIYFTGV